MENKRTIDLLAIRRKRLQDAIALGTKLNKRTKETGAGADLDFDDDIF